MSHMMQTYSGQVVDVLRPDRNVVRAVDIVHALSHICRFNGQCREFYSVAQHSGIVADMVVRGGHPGFELVALLHDATEAYLGDVISPLKKTDAMQRYRVLERDWAHEIAHAFAIGGSMLYELPRWVKEADEMALHVERRDLLGDGPGRAESLQAIAKGKFSIDLREWPELHPMSPVNVEVGLTEVLLPFKDPALRVWDGLHP